MPNFFDKHILVAGNGISGIGAKESLLKMGATVSTFCDGEQFEDKDYDLIVLSPSFEKNHFLYEYAKQKDIPIFGEYALGCMLNDKPLIAITGTNGKTTVTSMLSDIFSLSNKPIVCGNIGLSFSSCAIEDNYDVAITEVSSFQLEQTPYMCPKIAVITNITPDHLVRHKTMDEYAKIKFSITAHQMKDDYLILPYDDELYDLSLLKTDAKIVYVSAKQKVDGAYLLGDDFYFYGEKICSKNDMSHLSSYHNQVNALFAIAVSKVYGISSDDIVAALTNYKLPNHRIQLVSSINGVRFYNDSKSTNIDSTLKAIVTMKGNTVLILGGSEKGLDYSELFKNLRNVVKICAIGEIADNLISCAHKNSFFDIEKFDCLEKAVVNGFLLSPDNVLLSPATASFGEFSSYKERGEKFCKIVERIANGHD